MTIKDYNKYTVELRSFNEEVFNRRLTQIIIPEFLDIYSKVLMYYNLALLLKERVDKLFFRNSYRSPLYYAVQRGEIVDPGRLLNSGK